MAHRFENLTIEEHDFLTSIFLEIFMATVEDQLLAITASLADLKTAVAAIQAPTVDFTPVLTPLAALQTTVDAILAQDQPTPTPAPTPEPTA